MYSQFVYPQPVMAPPRPRRTLEEMEQDASEQVSLEYSEEIDSHLDLMERYTQCDSNMMEQQPELEWSMRPCLMDFLVESHYNLGLNAETLFLAVNIIDRYASRRIIYKRHYQLVGCSALWIASKYCDKKTSIPTLQELRQSCCGAYDTHMFVQMECHILNTLDWVIGHPTCDIFVDRLLEAEIGVEVALWKKTSLYFCECTIFHRSMLQYPASVIATAAVRLAGLVTKNLCYSSQFSKLENQCFNHMAHLIQSPQSNTVTTVDRKYSTLANLGIYNLVQSYLAAAAAAAAAAVAAAAAASAPATTDPCSAATSDTTRAAHPYHHNNHAAQDNMHPSSLASLSKSTTNASVALPATPTPSFIYQQTFTPPLQSNEFASFSGVHQLSSNYTSSHSHSHSHSHSNGYVTPPFTPNYA